MASVRPTEISIVYHRCNQGGVKRSMPPKFLAYLVLCGDPNQILVLLSQNKNIWPLAKFWAGFTTVVNGWWIQLVVQSKSKVFLELYMKLLTSV